MQADRDLAMLYNTYNANDNIRPMNQALKPASAKC